MFIPYFTHPHFSFLFLFHLLRHLPGYRLSAPCRFRSLFSQHHLYHSSFTAIHETACTHRLKFSEERERTETGHNKGGTKKDPIKELGFAPKSRVLLLALRQSFHNNVSSTSHTTAPAIACSHSSIHNFRHALATHHPSQHLRRRRAPVMPEESPGELLLPRGQLVSCPGWRHDCPLLPARTKL